MTSNAIAALFSIIQSLVDVTIAFFAGSLMEENRKLEDEMERSAAADRAVRDNRVRSFDERVRNLKQRGRVRGI